MVEKFRELGQNIATKNPGEDFSSLVYSPCSLYFKRRPQDDFFVLLHSTAIFNTRSSNSFMDYCCHDYHRRRSLSKTKIIENYEESSLRQVLYLSLRKQRKIVETFEKQREQGTIILNKVNGGSFRDLTKNICTTIPSSSSHVMSKFQRNLLSYVPEDQPSLQQ